ncbi:MAG: hypothetical protein AAFX56_01935 [Pseudomonadota bacterium]
MTEQENRRSFRIIETVYLNYEVLTEDEFAEGLERRKLRLGIDDGAPSRLIDLEARLSEAMYLLGAEHEKIGRCLVIMNDKINLAIDQLPVLKRTRTALTKQPPQTCEIGADGMAFGTEQALEIGSKLHLQMLFETDNRFIETFCKVVRDADSPSGPDSPLPFGTAIEFHAMQPAVREILIQHMFSKESQSLRMRRLQLEQDDPEA